MYALRKIWRPAVFQGAGRKSSYFEGWYFKCVSRDEDEIFAFIPGVAYSEDDSHAFLQFFDGKRELNRYLRYPVDAFSFSKKTFSLSLGENRFSAEGIRLAEEREEISLHGSLAFGDLSPWPVRVFSPGAMGWYAFVPKMEDYHGVLSFHHDIQGKITINGAAAELDRGAGYIEKDWGTSFPSRWIWIQSNHFQGVNAGLSLSVATIPWGKRHFTGFIIGFWLEGRLYSFSTYSGGEIVDYTLPAENSLNLLVRTKRYALRVSAKKIGGTKLNAPVAGAMVGHVNESMKSKVSVELTDRISGTIVFSGDGTSAGVELHGDIEGMLSSAVK